MKPAVVSDILAVGEFPTPEQIVILAKAGFRSLINNQPDGEVDRFPADAALGEAATKAGLRYAYAPLSSRTPEGEELSRYAAALKALPAPVYAFCYSGARSAAGAALLMTANLEVEQIEARFDGTGYDLASLRPWLDDARAAAVGGAGPRPEAVGAATEGACVDATETLTAAADPTPHEAQESAGGKVIWPRVAGGSGYAM